MDEKKYKLICVRKGKTNYARTNDRKNVTLGSYITLYTTFVLWPLSAYFTTEHNSVKTSLLFILSFQSF